MKKIVVTGGLGFIGSNLIDLLLKKMLYKDGLLMILYLRILKPLKNCFPL